MIASALVVMVGTLGVCAARGQEPAGPRVFVPDAGALAETRRRIAAGDKDLAAAVEGLRRDADKALKAGPFSVMDKKAVPPSGDKHDYMSVGPYWWPDPSKPDGKPYIRRDGETNADRAEYDNVPLGRMASAVTVLAQAWYFGGGEPYAEQAAQLLRAWFLDEKTRMNPHLNYGQAVPGVTDGRAAGIIDTTGLIGVVDAVGLLAGSKAWTDADQKAMQAWFENYLAWLLESKIGRDEAGAKNNHGTWYDAQVVSYALFVGKTDLARKVADGARARIDSQIEPDGRQPQELARTKSWDYSAMNLRGWFTLATLGDRVGVDLWNYRSADGRCLRKALDYLLPYAEGRQEWPHKQITRFQAARLLEPLRLAAAKYGDTKYADAARQVSGSKEPDWREALLRPRS